MRTLFTLVVLVAVAVGGAVVYGRYSTDAPTTQFRTAKIERGDLLITVGATGPLQPEEVVDIGAQVVGRISELGKDPRGKSDPAFERKSVDYGSPVEKGMVLAVIDPAVYQAQFNQAKAAVARAQADLLQMKARADQTHAEWVRAQKLHDLELPDISPSRSSNPSATRVPIRGITDADYILAKANWEIAEANVEVGKATILQQESAMELAETNLGYTIIRSPISGTIIERRVNVGQTVVSSMNAPSLFLIAEDLRRMQVWAAVNEADIGRLRVGMPVSFRVDALPDEVFRGEVYQIRLNAQNTQNVVIYTVVVSAENPDLKLLPYLTADVKFEVEKREGVLLVPNAALRYQPRPDQIAVPLAAGGSKASALSEEEAQGNEKQDSGFSGTLWVKTGNKVSPLAVKVGISDGVLTEVTGDGVNEGIEIVVGEQTVLADVGEVNNPFGPPKFRSRKK